MSTACTLGTTRAQDPAVTDRNRLRRQLTTCRSKKRLSYLGKTNVGLSRLYYERTEPAF